MATKTAAERLAERNAKLIESYEAAGLDYYIDEMTGRALAIPKTVTARQPDIADIAGQMEQARAQAEEEISQPIPIPEPVARQTAVPTTTAQPQFTDEQARGIAEQLIIRSNMDPTNFDELVSYIQNNGVDAALDLMSSQGAVIGSLREGFIPKDVASDVVTHMYTQYGIPQNSRFKNDWVKYVQRNGIDDAVDLFEKQHANLMYEKAPAKASGFSLLDSVTNKFGPELIEESRTAYTAGKRAELDDAISAILAGQDLTPAITDFEGTSEEFVDRLFKDARLDASPADRARFVSYTDLYGPEVALAEFNQNFRSFYGDRDVNPLFNLSSGSGFDPTDPYGQRGGAPSVPGGVPGGTTPPQAGLPAALPEGRSLLTATERPTLTPTPEIIEALAAERALRAPMQAYTPSDFGLTTLTPAQYAEAARAAALQAPSGVPVEPFSTPIASGEGMKEGGSVGGLKAIAQELQSKGRGGDTILAHINPQEAAMLKAMGGSGTINPETGLREYIFGRGKLIDINIGKKSQRALAAAAGVAAGFGALPSWAVIPGMSQIASTAVLTGIAGGLGNQNFAEGVNLGLTAFGAGHVASAANQAFPATTPSTGPIAPGSGGVQPMTDGVTADELLAGSGRGMAPAPTPIPAGGDTVANLANQKAAGSTILGMKPETALTGALLASSLYGGAQERAAYERQYEDFLREQEERKRRGIESFERSSMPKYAAQGGIVALARGGISYAEGGGTTGPANEPRMVKGNGDGMSDSVPATIEGVQEARLANDEFVIPADVVADIGNGSSSAGAKQLYAMMDRVRKARHGTTEQPPEINAMKLMPA